MLGLGTNSAWLRRRHPWATFLICIIARWSQLDMQIFVGPIFEQLVLTSSLLPRLRVVLFMEYRFQFQCFISRSRFRTEVQRIPNVAY